MIEIIGTLYDMEGISKVGNKKSGRKTKKALAPMQNLHLLNINKKLDFPVCKL